jgi:hypothetical protein
MDIVDGSRLILPPLEVLPGSPPTSRPPGIGGYLALGDLTILLGANDVGKSRLLRRIESDLAWREDWWRTWRGDFFAPLTTFFFRTDEADRRWLAAQASSDGEQTDAARSDAPHDFDLHVIAVATQGERDGDLVKVEPSFSFHRCSRPPAQGNAEAANEASDVLASTAARQPEPTDELARRDLSVLPVPVRLPADEAFLLGQIVDALGRWRRCVELFRKAFAVPPPGPNRPAADYGMPEDFEFAGFQVRNWALRHLADVGGDVLPEREWIVLEPTLSVPQPVERGLAFIEAHANAALPRFVSESYRIAAYLSPLPAWEARGAVLIGARPHGEDAVIPLAEIADGLRLWIQLAVTEGVDRLREATGGLVERWLTLSDELDVANGAVGGEDGLGWGPRDDTEVDRMITRAAGIAQAAIDPATVTPARLGLEAVARTFSAAEYSRWHRDESLFEAPSDPAVLREARGSIYLLDEPERHLHPRLQREAARHLESLVERSRSQALIVTHSPAFLSAAEGAQLAHLMSADGRSVLRSLAPEEITATSLVAEELGFDRGELLTNTRLLLAVEGPADRAVLEGRYGQELRAAGVVIAPLGGLQGQRQLLEMDVLLRYCAQRVAVIFDNTAEPDVRRIMTDPEVRRQAFSTKGRRALGFSEELAGLAGLVDRLVEQERAIAPVPFDVPDVLMALDEDCIRTTIASQDPRRVPYPGHEEAAAEHERRTPGVKPVNFKAFLRQRYGLQTDAASLGAIARNMRLFDRTTKPLAAAVKEILRLAHETL